jgi:hypothetical protein
MNDPQPGQITPSLPGTPAAPNLLRMPERSDAQQAANTAAIAAVEDRVSVLEDTLPKNAPWGVRWAMRLADKFLVPQWREAWKLLSVQWPVLCSVACEVYAENSEKIDTWVLSAIPVWLRPQLLALAFLVGAFLRVKLQKSKEKP